MIFIDIINEIILKDNKNIINFLCRPVITLKEKEKYELDIFYHNYKSTDFNKFYNELYELASKNDKRIEERQLVSLSNSHLKSFVN